MASLRVHRGQPLNPYSSLRSSKGRLFIKLGIIFYLLNRFYSTVFVNLRFLTRSSIYYSPLVITKLYYSYLEFLGSQARYERPDLEQFKGMVSNIELRSA